MAAFGRSIASKKAAVAAHDFSVKSVPRKARNSAPAPAPSAEVCGKKPEAVLVLPLAAAEDEGEIGLGDVESQLKELEVSSLTSDSTSACFGESTSAKSVGNAVEDRNISIAGTGMSTNQPLWWKQTLFFVLTVSATVAALVLAIYLKVKLEGLDTGPTPT